MGGGLQQEPLVPVGVQREGELLGAAVVHGSGAGSAADGGRHRLDPLQRRRRSVDEAETTKTDRTGFK